MSVFQPQPRRCRGAFWIRVKRLQAGKQLQQTEFRRQSGLGPLRVCGNFQTDRTWRKPEETQVRSGEVA